MAGIKDERGKPRVSLIDMSYVMGIIQTFEHGAETYELNNWLQLKPETLYNAMFRHMAAMAMGEYYDSKSGLPHLFHVGANAMMIYTLTKKQEKFESNFDLFNGENEWNNNDIPLVLQEHFDSCKKYTKEGLEFYANRLNILKSSTKKQYINEYPDENLYLTTLQQNPQALLDFLLKLGFDKEAILSAFELYKVGSGVDNSVWFWFLDIDSKPLNAIIVQKEEFLVGESDFDFWSSHTLGKNNGKNFTPVEGLIYGDHLLREKLPQAKKLYITATPIAALIIHLKLKTETVVAATTETLANENCSISDCEVCLINPDFEKGSVIKAGVELMTRGCKVVVEN